MGSKFHKIAGVVLAGGRSRRMGQSKALLPYRKGVLLEHMLNILGQSDVTECYVSGQVDGFMAMADTAPFSGPAHAIQNVVAHLSHYQGIVFLPVDMPNLTPDIINEMLSHKAGGYYHKMYLPAYITQKDFGHLSGKSVQEMWRNCQLSQWSMPVEYAPLMGNCNTPDQWQDVLKIG